MYPSTYLPRMKQNNQHMKLLHNYSTFAHEHRPGFSLASRRIHRMKRIPLLHMSLVDEISDEKEEYAVA